MHDPAADPPEPAAAASPPQAARQGRQALLEECRRALAQQRAAWAARAAGLRHARLTRRARLGIAAFACVLAASAAAIVPYAGEIANEVPEVARVEVEVASAAGEAQAALLDHHGTVLRQAQRLSGRETFNGLVAALGVRDAQSLQALRQSEAARLLLGRQTRAVHAEVGDDGSLRALAVRAAQISNADPDTLAITDTVFTRRADGAGFESRSVTVPVERRLKLARGVVRSSLFQAADEAGVPDAVTIQLAEVFAGDIDFYTDLRRGDSFDIVYEMLGADGEVLRPGRLLAAVFVNKGKRYDAVWYVPQGLADAQGAYYTFDGASLRRAFLRAPLEFSRVSSGFGGRMHPIHNQWRMHRGVDYAAPTGTPIRATADGIVKFAGRQGGYGNVVELEHRGDIHTLYAHMSGFAAGLTKGARVRQGQVIGYVGATGWATGPHLHYEFRQRGVHVNPLTVALPEAAPIDAAQIAHFVPVAREARRRTELASTVALAPGRMQ